MKYQIKDRWSGDVKFTADINCDEGAPQSDKKGLAVKWAVENGVSLHSADLMDADLSNVNLSGANWIPVIPNIHTAVYEAASKKDALDMSTWHKGGNFCGTTHCRAGWVTHLAGESGRVMDKMLGTDAAAALIYMKSDPSMEKIPDWIAGNDETLADMKRLADAEKAMQS